MVPVCGTMSIVSSAYHVENQLMHFENFDHRAICSTNSDLRTKISEIYLADIEYHIKIKIRSIAFFRNHEGYIFFNCEHASACLIDSGEGRVEKK